MNIFLRRHALAALIGLLVAGVSIGVGELVAALLRPAASPVIAVGNRLILLTPESVKRAAIRQFGTNDKTALQGGIYLALAGLAVLIGLVAVHSLRLGLAGVALLGAVGGYAALTANAHRGSDVIPSIVGALAGMAALAVLVGTVTGNRAVTGDGTVTGNQAVSGEQPTSRRPGALLADRRGFLQGGVVSAAVAVLGGFGGRALQRRRYDASAARAAVRLPPAVSGPLGQPGASAGAVGAANGGTNFDLGKSGLPFQTPADRFYRIDTALSVPQLNPDTWKLRLHGMVERPMTLTFAELLARPLVERWVTLTCVSNEVGGDLISNARFRGVLLADLLREAGVSAEASQLVASSSDGMTIGSPTAVVMDGRDAMLAVGMNGEPLPTEHGFPVRMVVPGLYGYVSACKWIVDLEATTFDNFKAYWVKGGWAPRGPIKLASRIDRPGQSQTVTVGSSVPIAGVAWDQHVGVSKVEVQVDAGPWQQARLAPVPSADTWRQWVYLWTPPSPGTHTLRVRAFDAGGNPQDESVTDPFPAGATGLHSVTVRAR